MFKKRSYDTYMDKSSKKWFTLDYCLISCYYIGLLVDSDVQQHVELYTDNLLVDMVIKLKSPVPSRVCKINFILCLVVSITEFQPVRPLMI
jgi:hypothetical protein